jgi:hypothetical protein
MTKDSIKKLLEIQELEDASTVAPEMINLPGTPGYLTVKDELLGLTGAEEHEYLAELFFKKQEEDGYTQYSLVSDPVNGCILWSSDPNNPGREHFQAVETDIPR